MLHRYTFALFVPLLVISNCGEHSRPEIPKDELFLISSSRIPIKPVPFSDPGIRGFAFPEKEEFIEQWIVENDVERLAQHGWGIWTGLTTYSGKLFGDQPLRIYETWYTPEDIAVAIRMAQRNRPFDLAELPRTRGKLERPEQFRRAEQKQVQSMNDTVMSAIPGDVVGFVKYDPTAAQFTIERKLFLTSVLSMMLKKGKTDIPDFPRSSIVIKPVYKIVTKSMLVNGLYRMKAWTGPPSTPVAFGEDLWPGCVYIDPYNRGEGNGSVDFSGSHPTPETTRLPGWAKCKRLFFS